jgi:hypothetical protein
VFACGCAQSGPQESATSREIAQLERELSTESKSAPATSGGPEVVDPPATASTPAATLSPQFGTVAVEARGFVVKGLIVGSPRNTEAQVAADLASARAKLHDARGVARSDDDKNVHLLLTLMVAKDKEWQQAMSMSRRAGKPVGEYAPESAKLYDQLEVCDEELRGWLNGSVAPEQLRQAPCMTEARGAAAMADGR